MRAAARAGLAVSGLFGACLAASGQLPGFTAQPQTLDRTPATLHGVVRNAATGEGVPRALVRVEGDADTGMLTDGDGRFEIANIPVGPQHVEVSKPGFVDRGAVSAGPSFGPPGQFVQARSRGGHNVMVAAQMEDVVFTLAPCGAVRGQVELSTGDAAQGITISLARRTISEGRALWQMTATAKTRSDGSYRFGGLEEGDYAVFSQPTMDSELDEMPGPAGAAPRWGYASVYYPGARDPSGAGRIRVASGEESQANLTLTLEPFQTVSAAVMLPQNTTAALLAPNLEATVLDSAGHALAYPAQYNQKSHTVEAELPDGNYLLMATSNGRMGVRGIGGRVNLGPLNAGTLVGAVEVSVAGHAATNLRLPLAAPGANAVQLTVAESAVQASGQGGRVTVLVSQAGGWIDDGMMNMFLEATAPGAAETLYNKPGSYWVHTHVQQRGLCEASFTAGGANLGRDPLTIGLSGSSAPLELALRSDCAGLSLSLPQSQTGIAAGEEPFYTVYAVPDFDTTVDVQAMTLRASTGGTMTMQNLTPGGYHVYTFAGAVELEYRNREALAALPTQGQAITLSPGTTGSLVLEVPGQ